ncbi:MAG: hypothetical protein LBI78_07760 [Campylobacteraceae bacterium]|jgi:hypothetical protein|nr:hypothetical protein [Campylobacteraceae bacterium]
MSKTLSLIFINPKGLFIYTLTAGASADETTESVISCMDTCTRRNFVITGTTESGHSVGSAHETGQACDIGKNSNPGLGRNDVERCFNQCATNSSYGQEEGNHYHIQTRPGRGGSTGFVPGIR